MVTLRWSTLVLFWLFPVLYLAGVVVCLIYRKLSPWMVLLVLGFGGELVLSVMSAFTTIIVNVLLVGSTPAIRLFFLLRNIGHLSFRAMIILGLLVVFAEVHKKLKQATERDPESTPEPVPDRLPLAPDALEPWNTPKESSHDIQ